MKHVYISIGKKLAVAFGVIMIAIVAFAISIQRTINDSERISNRISSVTMPSVKYLKELSIAVKRSSDITSTIAQELILNPQLKQKVQNIHRYEYPKLISQLAGLQKNWEPRQARRLSETCRRIEDSLFLAERKVIRAIESSAYSQDSSTIIVEAQVDHAGQARMAAAIAADLDRISDEFILSSTGSYFELRDSVYRFESYIYLWVILIILLAIVVSILMYDSFVKPIRYVRNELNVMSQGVLNEKIKETRDDEIGEMIRALENLTSSLLKTKDFAKEIARGNYNAQFRPLSSRDELGNSLIDLRDNLEKAINEANERRAKEQIQNWTTQGLAKFADILRQNNNNFEALGKHVLRNLVEYMGINQGGIFVYYDEDKQNPYLELIAVYAYNRDKYLKKRVVPGEGLVGTCFVEKRTMYMTEVPNGYLSITSGLGKANPRSIVIVPLKIEEKVLGVLELASFRNFESHEVEFVERIGESIAATIQTVRINEETSRLLNFTTQQTEAMKAQEEEMCQNMEELLATQEDAHRREQELTETLAQLQEELENIKNA